MRKKSMSAVFWMYLIIIVVTLVLVLLFINKVRQSSVETVEKTSCKESVKIYSQTSSHLEATDPAESVNCPTNHVKLEGRDQNKLKREIADEMFDCWDNFGQGKYNMFKNNKVYCHICSVIDFEENMMIDDISSYFLSTLIPNKDITYWDFFIDKDKSKVVLNKLEESGYYSLLTRPSKWQDIDVENRDLAVVFVYIKGKAKITTQIAREYGSGIFFSAGGILSFAVNFVDVSLFGVKYNNGWYPLAVVNGEVYPPGTEFSSVIGDATKDKGTPSYLALVALTDYDGTSINRLECEEFPFETVES